MNCKEAYALLFMYARDTIQPEDRRIAEEHISSCPRCAGIASALAKLAPQMTLAQEDENTHYFICIPLENGECVSYFGFTCHFNNHAQLNAILNETGGSLPDGEEWINCGHDNDFEHLAEFDNDGNHIGFELRQGTMFPNNVRVVYREMKKVFYPRHWCHTSTYSANKIGYSQSTEAPNLYYGHLQNSMGNNAKSALYLAVPGDAANVRVKRGNGVIDCGTYKFTYVDRYVTEEETIVLDCSFLK